jgi:hypothetical protein
MWSAVLAAGIWASVLVVGAFVIPVYGTATLITTAPAPRTPPGPIPLTQTVVEVEGLSGVVKMAVPLLVTLLVAVALRRGVHQASRVIAWSATVVLAVLGLLFMPDGIVMLPATVALVGACFLASRVARATGT